MSVVAEAVARSLPYHSPDASTAMGCASGPEHPRLSTTNPDKSSSTPTISPPATLHSSVHRYKKAEKDSSQRRLSVFATKSEPASPSAMADGRVFERNEARAMRIVEIMNDFRTLQLHISSLITRAEASPPTREQFYLDGYVVLRQCGAEAQAILATHYNPRSIGLSGGATNQTEVDQATLQRIILDASTRRFQAHKIYLRAAAGIRWVQLRTELFRREKNATRIATAIQAIDQRLRDELQRITDESVVADLRSVDRRKGYWLDEDPTLQRMLAWIRTQH